MGPAPPPSVGDAEIGSSRNLTRERQPAVGLPHSMGLQCIRETADLGHVIAQPPIAVPSEASAATIARPPARAFADGVEGQLCRSDSN